MIVKTITIKTWEEISNQFPLKAAVFIEGEWEAMTEDRKWEYITASIRAADRLAGHVGVTGFCYRGLYHVPLYEPAPALIMVGS